MKYAIVVTLISSWYLAGLSVTVALNVYPSFEFFDGEKWQQSHEHHSNRISWAVGPAWIVQAAGLAIWLFSSPQSTLAIWTASALFALGAVGLTIFSAVPIHQKLSQGFNADLLRKLRFTHVLRTISWLLGALCTTLALLQVL
jgi:hypothetical protein